MIGGIWSLSRFTIETIFMAVFCRELSIALRTFMRSVKRVTSQLIRQLICIKRSISWLTSFGFRPCNCDFDQPFLPHDLLVIAPSNSSQPSTLPSFLVEELDSNLPSDSTVWCVGRSKLMYEGGSSRIYECLKFRRLGYVR